MTGPVGTPPPKPIPLRERASILFIERGELNVLDGAFVVVDDKGVRIQLPVGAITCLMLEPGSRVSHAAVALAARVGCLLMWVGEAGVRLYAAGQPGGTRANRLLYQAALALDDSARLAVVRKMYALRFGEEPPARRSVDQLRGIEGARVRALYATLAQRHEVSWQRRHYDPKDWDSGDIVNRCLSQATACLYGVSEAAILACGYAPAIGFLHTGKARSFVFDIADIYKFDTVVPVAFEVAGLHRKGDRDCVRDPIGEVRRRCRDGFRRSGLLRDIIPAIDAILAAGGKEPPEAHEEAMPVAFQEAQSGEEGHRG